MIGERGNWGIEEMRKWGNGERGKKEMGKEGKREFPTLYSLLSIPYSLFSIPKKNYWPIAGING